jgi:hypothetical protein
VIAVKVAVVVPAATTTERGTVKIALLLARVTGAPPAGAAWLRLTVQVADALTPKSTGTHDREDVPGTVMTAPVGAETLTAVPLALTATGFDIDTSVVTAAGAIVRFTYAAIPEAIMFAFSPVSRQVDEPGTETQVNDLPAAVAEGPTVRDKAET